MQRPAIKIKGLSKSYGDVKALNKIDITINEGEGMLTPFRGMPTVQDVANSLNALGVTPRDMMAIFQAMKQAGALQAELVLK